MDHLGYTTDLRAEHTMNPYESQWLILFDSAICAMTCFPTVLWISLDLNTFRSILVSTGNICWGPCTTPMQISQAMNRLHEPPMSMVIGSWIKGDQMGSNSTSLICSDFLYRVYLCLSTARPFGPRCAPIRNTVHRMLFVTTFKNFKCEDSIQWLML